MMNISIFLHVSEERTYDGDGQLYDGLDSRLQATISTIDGGPMRSVH